MNFYVPKQVADEAYDISLTRLAVKAKIREATRTGRLKTERFLLVHMDAMTESELERIAVYDEWNDNWFVVQDNAVSIDDK